VDLGPCDRAVEHELRRREVEREAARDARVERHVAVGDELDIEGRVMSKALREKQQALISSLALDQFLGNSSSTSPTTTF
jgi:hypothetical protein